MADGKVSILPTHRDRTVSGAGQGCGGSGRRRCTAVVVLVVRTDAGRGEMRGAAAAAARKIPGELRELKKSGEEGFRRPIPRAAPARSGSCRATRRN